MAKIKLQGNASGTGVLTVTAPNTSTDRTITLPDGDVTMGVGIDDNANATAITIDSSENVLIGKTTYVGGSGVTGIDIRPSGMLNIAREGDTLMYMNRKNSDGDIVEFRKDGTTVGSIGVTSSNQFYIARTTGSQGIKFKNSATMPCASNGNDADNAQDLGSSSSRWKDLYLSGGLKVGGTDAAHTLDDYEEGTWTAGLQGANQSGMNTTGYYTKIGRQVFFQWYSGAMTISSASGPAKVTGLPFTSSNASSAYGLFFYLHGNSVDGASTGGYVQDVATYFRFVDTNNITDATYVDGSSKYIMVSGSYFVS